MISGSLSPRKTAAAQIAPTELPVVIASASECNPVCSEFSPCSMKTDERLRDMFVRPMNKKMGRLWDAILMPLSPECFMLQQPDCICSPLTELKKKKRALLFD